MKKAETPVELIVAILLAAFLIAGSLVFLGLQFRPQTEPVSATFDAEQLKQQIKRVFKQERYLKTGVYNNQKGRDRILKKGFKR